MAHQTVCQPPHIYKKPRKQREIKNPVINIDDVFIAPGSEHFNWLEIARKKLTDRELITLRRRQRILDRFVIDGIQEFVDANKLMNPFNFSICIDIYQKEIRHKLINPHSAIVSLFALSIGNALQKWKGCKTEKDIHSFRDYFRHCRHWFDTRKIRMMAIHFWIPSMQLIREFAMKASARLFGSSRSPNLQTAFCDYLSVSVLRSVFEAHMKPSNCRSMCLIPAMSYPVFLKRYNHHLRVVVTHSTKNKKMRREYIELINIKHNALRDAFHAAMNRPLSSPPLSSSSQTSPMVQIDNVNVISSPWSADSTTSIYSPIRRPHDVFSMRCAPPVTYAPRTTNQVVQRMNNANPMWRPSCFNTNIVFFCESNGSMVAYRVSF
eukprot:880758_1